MLQPRRVPADEPPASDLLAAMVTTISEMYDGLQLDAPDMPSASVEDFRPPGGAYVVLFEGDIALAGGGFKRLDEEACEIKRMYVTPEARGRGLGKALLTALEDEARAAGYAIARLDTGPRQAGAQALYERAGYRPIGNFNANPVASFWGEKALGPDGVSARGGPSSPAP